MPDVLARYTIGFFKGIKGPNEKYILEPCGSGVLIALDEIKGAVTAAHVIREIEKAPHAALFTIVNAKEKARQLKFETSEMQAVVFGGEENEDGPDLGFVRFPTAIEESLVAENTFYNYNVRAARASEGSQSLQYSFLCGIIAEKSELKSQSENSRIDTHTMSLAAGIESGHRTVADGFDIFKFKITHNEEVTRPNSYGGLSGSAVWEVADSLDVNDRIVSGVAFRQSDPDSNGDRVIMCHGPISIYQKLIPTIRQRFSK